MSASSIWLSRCFSAYVSFLLGGAVFVKICAATPYDRALLAVPSMKEPKSMKKRPVMRNSRGTGPLDEVSKTISASGIVRDAESKKNSTHGFANWEGGTPLGSSRTLSLSSATKSVALHISLYHHSPVSGKGGQGPSWKHFMMELLEKCHYCFDEVLITIDPKHGGKVYGHQPAYLGPPYANGTHEFLASVAGQALIRQAEAVLAEVSLRLQQHCSGRKAGMVDGLRTEVLVIDYASPSNQALLREAFDLKGPVGTPQSPWRFDAVPPGAENFPFARMWKASFMYNYVISAVQSDMVLHMDGDEMYLHRTGYYGGSSRDGIQLTRPEHHSIAHTALEAKSFVSRAVVSLTAHSDVVRVSPAQCEQYKDKSGGQWAVYSCFAGCESLGTDLTIVRSPYNSYDYRLPPPEVSDQIYVADVRRWKSLWPLKYWTDFHEILFGSNLRDKNMVVAQLQSGLADTCKSNFNKGLEYKRLVAEDQY